MRQEIGVVSRCVKGCGPCKSVILKHFLNSLEHYSPNSPVDKRGMQQRFQTLDGKPNVFRGSPLKEMVRSPAHCSCNEGSREAKHHCKPTDQERFQVLKILSNWKLELLSQSSKKNLLGLQSSGQKPTQEEFLKRLRILEEGSLWGNRVRTSPREGVGFSKLLFAVNFSFFIFISNKSSQS